MKKKKNKIINYIKKNKYDILFYAIVLIAFTYIYFQVHLYITYDGAYYHSYIGYFNGLYPFSNWDTIRGPVFPFILFIFTKLFGNSGNGVLFGLYLFEIGFVSLSYYILKSVLKENNYDIPSYIKILFILLVILNPYIFGYSHLLLTESVMPLFYILVGFICLKFYRCEMKDKKKSIKYSAILCLLSIIIYSIKQPYAPACWMAIFITALLSGIYFKSKKEFFKKLIVFLIAIVLTILSVNGWNLFLKLNGKTNDKTTTSLISGFEKGMPYHLKRQSTDKYCTDSVLNDYKFNKKDYDQLADIINDSNQYSWCSNVNIYSVYDMNQEYVESYLLVKSSGLKSISNNLKFLFRMYFNHPILAIHSYMKNYLAIVDLVNVTDIFSDFTPNGGITYDVTRENDQIAMVPYIVGISNAFWEYDSNYKFSDTFPDDPHETMKDYVSVTTNNTRISTLFRLIEPLSKFTFKFLMSCSIIFMIYGLVNFIKYGKKQIYFIITLFSGMAFVTTAFNAFYAANIDRYVYANYALMLIVLLLTLINKKDLLKEKKK